MSEPPEVAHIILPTELFKRTKVGDRIDFDGRMSYEVEVMDQPAGMVECKRAAAFSRYEACALLRRAADAIAILELDAGGTTQDAQVLPDIGAFLGRVAKP